MNRLFGVVGAAALGAIMVIGTGNGAAAKMLKDDPSRLLAPSGPSAASTAAEPDETIEEAEKAGQSAQGGKATRGGRYDDLIRRHAEAAGVPEALAHAVVRIESNYNAGATGRAGEVGLMQIKPRTARGIGFSGSTKALYDADTNLRWGMKYLAGAYKLAGGDLCGTIMRYQGGHYARRMTGANSAYCGRVRSIMANRGVQLAAN